MIKRLFFISSILFFVLGVVAFLVGFHGIDLAWNGKYIEHEFNATLTDTGLTGEAKDMNQVYSSGVFNMFASLFFMFTSFVLFLLFIVLR
jgi:hypothetical protein